MQKSGRVHAPREEHWPMGGGSQQTPLPLSFPWWAVLEGVAVGPLRSWSLLMKNQLLLIACVSQIGMKPSGKFSLLPCFIPIFLHSWSPSNPILQQTSSTKVCVSGSLSLETRLRHVCFLKGIVKLCGCDVFLVGRFWLLLSIFRTFRLFSFLYLLGLLSVNYVFLGT